VDDRAGEGRAYGNLGNVYQTLGKFHEAIEYHSESLSIAKEVGDRASEGSACCNLGKAFLSLRKIEDAIEHHSQHLSIAKEVGDRAGEGKAYGGLGEAYHNLGKFQEAIESHCQHLSIAKEVGDRASEGRAYGNLSIVYKRLGKFQEAIEYHGQNLSIAKEVGDRYGEGVAYSHLGKVYLHLKKLQEAKECFKSSLQVLDIARASLKSEDALKISFRNFYSGTYNGLWSTLLLLDRTDEALCAVEQGRAQALVDGLKIKYGLTALPSGLLKPTETISYISNAFSTQTVFLVVQNNTIVFWVTNKERKFELRIIKIDGRSVLETTLRKIGAGVGVRCENRSLDEPTDDSWK